MPCSLLLMHFPLPYETLVHTLSFLVPQTVSCKDRSPSQTLPKSLSPTHPDSALFACLSVNQTFRRAASAILNARILHWDVSPASVRWTESLLNGCDLTVKTVNVNGKPSTHLEPQYPFHFQTIKALRTFHMLTLERNLKHAMRRRADHTSNETDSDEWLSSTVATVTPRLLDQCQRLDTIVLVQSHSVIPYACNGMAAVSNFGSTLRTLHIHPPYTSYLSLLAETRKLNDLEELVIDHGEGRLSGLDSAVATLLRCQTVKEIVPTGNRGIETGRGGKLRNFVLKGVNLGRNDEFLVALTECRTSTASSSLASSLRRIYVPDMALTPTVILRLAQCTNLEALSIDNFAKIYDRDFKTPSPTSPSAVYSNGFPFAFSRSTTERFGDRQSTSGLLPVFLSTGRNLRCLSLRCGNTQTLEQISKHCPNLESLSLILHSSMPEWMIHSAGQTTDVTRGTDLVAQPAPFGSHSHCNDDDKVSEQTKNVFRIWMDLARNCGRTLRTLRLSMAGRDPVPRNRSTYSKLDETHVHFLRTIGSLFIVLETLRLHNLRNTLEVFNSIYRAGATPFPSIKRVQLSDSQFQFHTARSHTTDETDQLRFNVQSICPQAQFDCFSDDNPLWDDQYFS